MEKRRKNHDYKKQSYWDERFQEEEHYDWLVTYEGLAEHFEKLIPKDARVLTLGCGNSDMSANLFDAGWTNITNTDYSSVALTFDEKSFDCVIDKAAMDAIMCDEGDVWSPGMENITQADAMCTGVSKVLKDDGIFLQVSFAQPHFRKKYLNGTHARQAGIGRGHYNWEIETKEVAGQTFPHFLYVMRRRCCQL